MKQKTLSVDFCDASSVASDIFDALMECVPQLVRADNSFPTVSRDWASSRALLCYVISLQTADMERD